MSRYQAWGPQPRRPLARPHGYLFGSADDTVLFWGDTVHSHAVQLRRPIGVDDADSDEAAAVASRRRVFDAVATNRWWVGGAHLPFPGLGHLRRDPDRSHGAGHLHAGQLTPSAEFTEISMMVAGDTDQGLSRLCRGLFSDSNSHEHWTS